MIDTCDEQAYVSTGRETAEYVAVRHNWFSLFLHAAEINHFVKCLENIHTLSKMTGIEWLTFVMCKNSCQHYTQ